MTAYRERVTIIYVNPVEKIIILTVPRSASSFCHRELTEETGWLPRCTMEQLGADKMFEYHNQGFKFFCIVKDPMIRLVSGMEIVVPSLTIESETKNLMDAQLNFKSTINLIVHKIGLHDVRRFGALNYNCNDIHMMWGAHATGMFLEAVGIPVTPLILDTAESLDEVELHTQTFNSFLINLNFGDFQSAINNEKIDTNLDLFRNRLINRLNRYHAWIQTCSKLVDAGGNILAPSYTVHDWISHDYQLFNNFLNLQHNSTQNRSLVARQVITSIIQDMWKKLNISNIADNMMLSNNEMLYPWDTMFNLMGSFKDYRDILPEFYVDEFYTELFDNKYVQSRRYPVLESTPESNITSFT